MAMASDIKFSTIYVSLLEEGTDVWRPVQALPVGGDKFVLIRPCDYDERDETWEFLPGAIVRVETRLRGGESLKYAVGSTQKLIFEYIGSIANDVKQTIGDVQSRMLGSGCSISPT